MKKFFGKKDLKIKYIFCFFFQKKFFTVAIKSCIKSCLKVFEDFCLVLGELKLKILK